MHVQFCQIRENSPRNRGEKDIVKPQSTHINENWGRQAQTAKSTGTTTSTRRKKSSHTGHSAAPNRGKQVGRRAHAAVALLSGVNLGVLPTHGALDVHRKHLVLPLLRGWIYLAPEFRVGDDQR